MDIVSYALAKKLVNGVQSGLANATVDNDNCSITFNWTNGTSSTMTFPKPADGVSITNAYIDDTNHLMMELSSGATIDAGVITGGDGGSYDDTAIKADIDSLEVDLLNVQNDMVDLETENINIKTDVASIKTDLATTQTELTTVKADLTIAKTDIDTLEADVDSLEGKEIDTLTYANSELTLTAKDTTTKTVTIMPNLVDLGDVDITSPNGGDVVTYSASTGKFTTGQVSSTDQYVKMTATDTNAAYLADLIDDDTIKNNGSKLEVEKIKGQNITVDELNTLVGMDTNVKDTLNALSSGGMTFKDVVPTYADLPNSAVNGFVYIVNADETDNGNRNAYIYSDDHAGFVLVGTSGLDVRNFTTNPIDLTSEVTNILPKDKMDTADLVDKTKDIINTLSYPIPNEDLEKIPNLEVLKQINTEVINALNGKMNNTDIVDNLTDNSVDKPLSANQGNVLDTKIGHKIDNDKIVTTLDSTVTDEQIPSAKVTHNELSKKVDKTDITTTISETPSDEKVVSEKAVSDIVPFKFGIDDKGNYGYYKAGADTVTPFSSGFESIAPEHDETETYNTDDIVLFNDELYSCTEDGVTGVFNLNKWNKISITDIGGNGSSNSDYIYTGTTSPITTSFQTQNLGFRPKLVYAFIYVSNTTALSYMLVDDNGISNKIKGCYVHNGSGSGYDIIGSESSDFRITDDGFKYRDSSRFVGRTINYIAIK